MYWKLKEETVDRTLWGSRFARSYGQVVRQTTERVNDFLYDTAKTDGKICFYLISSSLAAQYLNLCFRNNTISYCYYSYDVTHFTTYTFVTLKVHNLLD